MKALAFFVLFALGCPPPASPAPDAADGAPLEGASPSSASLACRNLAAIGCLEGASATCSTVLEHVVDAGLTPIHLACLATATTKEGARACGGVSCP
jgi:hypothetical protein